MSKFTGECTLFAGEEEFEDDDYHVYWRMTPEKTITNRLRSVLAANLNITNVNIIGVIDDPLDGTYQIKCTCDYEPCAEDQAFLNAHNHLDLYIYGMSSFSHSKKDTKGLFIHPVEFSIRPIHN